jgi:starch synthase
MNPFHEVSKISNIARELPQKFHESGCEIRVLMPRFGCINERRNRLHEVIRLSGMNIVVNDTDNGLIIKVASMPTVKLQVYFLDNEDFFKTRKADFNCSNSGKFYEDNAERMIFYCKGAIETIRKLGWVPDYVHVKGWFGSLVPAYLKTEYKNDPIFTDTKVIYSAYAKSFDDNLGEDFLDKATLKSMQVDDLLTFKDADYFAIVKGAMNYADVIHIDEEAEDEFREYASQLGKPTFEKNPVDSYEEFLHLLHNIKAIEGLEVEAQ